MCEGLRKMSEGTWVLVVLQIGIKAAITLRELSISPANDEVFAQAVSCGDAWAKIMRVNVGNDLSGGNRNARARRRRSRIECASRATNSRIKRVDLLELILRNENRAGRRIKVVHQTVCERRHGIIVPAKSIVQGEPRRQLEGVLGVEPQFLTGHRSIHEGVGSADGERQSEQKISKTAV